MKAIFKREIRSFFTSPVGYLVISLFLLLNGLFLWVFKSAYNIFDYGFADLNKFFTLVPWVFLFLIPAITMKSFAEEKKLGTLELLYSKPISLWQIVLGKFSGTFVLTLIALAPSLLYVYTVSQLGTTVGNLDIGPVIGSYLGIMLLIACYTAIGLFASTFSENQIVAFVLAVFICFVFYYGFESLSTLFADGKVSVFVQHIGMKSHFENIARGVVDTRNIIYQISLTLFFQFLTVVQLKNQYR